MTAEQGGQSVEKAQDAERLGRLRTAAWDTLRAFNANPNKVNADAHDNATLALVSACDLFRQRHAHPKATEVFVTCDHTIGQELTVWQRRPWRGKNITEQVYRPGAPS